MTRRTRHLLFVSSLIVAASFSSSEAAQAQSGPKDAAAKKLADDAMNNDYLTTNFVEAEKKLRKALTTCGASGCSPQIQALLHRDLGVVLVAGLNRADEGKAEFVEALKADPKTELEKDFITPDIKRVWEAAKGGDAAPAAGSEAPSAPVGELVHQPPTEQTVHTPLPIYVETGGAGAKAVVRYRAPASSEWKPFELQKMGKGFGGELGCTDMGTSAGNLSYYIELRDDRGEVVATSGSRSKPYKVAIKQEISGDAPHLPDHAAPAKCGEADCPPGFPCAGKTAQVGSGKAQGESCTSDVECAEGLCRKGTCDNGPGGPLSMPCDSNSDCDGGTKCVDHNCETEGGAASGSARKFWVSLGAQQDLMWLSSERNICAVGHSSQWTCLAEDGFEYGDKANGIYGNPAQDAGNALKSSGFAAASTRVLVGLDYLLTPNVTLGARVGYAFNMGPGALGFHVEGRAAYWFGRTPFARATIRPFAAIVVGAAEFTTKLSVPIFETEKANASAGIYVNDDTNGQTLTVWRHSRVGFGGASVGAMIPLGSPRHGVLVESKFLVSFPQSGFTLSPALSYVVGF